MVCISIIILHTNYKWQIHDGPFKFSPCFEPYAGYSNFELKSLSPLPGFESTTHRSQYMKQITCLCATMLQWDFNSHFVKHLKPTDSAIKYLFWFPGFIWLLSSQLLPEGHRVLNLGNVGKVGSVWDAQTSHSYSEKWKRFLAISFNTLSEKSIFINYVTWPVASTWRTAWSRGKQQQYHYFWVWVSI